MPLLSCSIIKKEEACFFYNTTHRFYIIYFKIGHPLRKGGAMVKVYMKIQKNRHFMNTDFSTVCTLYSTNSLENEPF